ncbi:MAG: hypothetical protein JRI68_17295 [Deltaproteobacteria bacterium]|nr:hypothetical protein [Deltaproteobacteria bacterium]
MLRRLLALAPLPFAVVGCGDSGGVTQGTLGDLGEGIFTYVCVDDGDAVCNETAAVNPQDVEIDLGINGEMPSAVAVGARFDIHYSGHVMTDDGEILLVDVVPAQSDEVHTKGGFIITSPGTYAFLARSPKGIVGDFTHLEAVEATDLDVWKDKARVTSFELTVGAEVNLAVVPNDDVGITLAGALPYTWESSNDTVLVIGPAGGVGTPTGGVEINEDEVRLVALAEGEVELTVARADLTKQVTVTVTPEVTP